VSSLEEKLSKQLVIKDNIGVAQQEVTSLLGGKEKAENSLTMLRSTQSLFSPTGIPAYILDSIISMFNDKIQNYISNIWPQSSFELQSFRENKAGQVSAKMSDNLTIDGVKVPVHSLSGGEIRCLSIAIDMALLDVVMNYTGVDISPIILDEPFENLDVNTREIVIDMLRQVASDRLVIVIDHATETQAMFDTIINIEKRDSISRIA
jgi:DNA repair exonuclease SbcCD ATPase subunit